MTQDWSLDEQGRVFALYVSTLSDAILEGELGTSFARHLVRTRHSPLFLDDSRLGGSSFFNVVRNSCGASVKVTTALSRGEGRTKSMFTQACIPGQPGGDDMAMFDKLTFRAAEAASLIQAVSDHAVRRLILQNFVETAANFVFGGAGSLAFFAVCASACPDALLGPDDGANRGILSAPPFNEL